MKRRDFVKTSISASMLAASASTMGLASYNNLFGYSPDAPYDLVAVKGGEPELMFDRAIASVGGMKSLVARGQTVVVKPNIGWDAAPERAANTNPKLVARIVEHCIQAGAKDVFVFDHTCDTWTKCYSRSGIEKAVKDAGGKMVSGASEGYYQTVESTSTKILKSVKIHELILESDVFINVPVLKHHSSARLTMAMKNLMGVVWDRRYWHNKGLNQCIAEFPLYRKPDLNIIDAYALLKRNGPRGVSTADVLYPKSLLMSSDIVAIDTAATKIFGSEPSSISYIRMADENNIGTSDLSSLNINRIKI